MRAVLLQPQAVTADRSGNIYVSDPGDHRVRRIDASGVIHTIAGTGKPGSRGDAGPAVEAQLNAPYGLSLDSAGNLYVADLGNALVRRVSVDGVIKTAAGGGRETPSPDKPIEATAAKLVQPRDVVVDRAGNVFIADFGAHFVYKVTSDGMLSVVAGTGKPGTFKEERAATGASLSHPSALAIDAAGALLIADSGNGRVRRVAFERIGTLLDKSRKEIEIGTPISLAADISGRIFIADSGAPVLTVLPSGDQSYLDVTASGISAVSTSGLLFTSGRQVQRFSGGRITPIAGVSGNETGGDGSDPLEWRFTSPSAILRDLNGALCIADTANGRVRRLTSTGVLTTIAAELEAPISLAMDSRARLYVGDRASGGVYRLDNPNPPKLIVRGESRPIQPAAIVFDTADNLYIADAANNLIRRVAPDGDMTVVTGTGKDTTDGPALLSKLSNPAGLAFDSSGALWFSEAASGRIRRIANGQIVTLPGIEFREPRGIRFDRAGNLWVADAGAHRVYRIDPTGIWDPAAGSGDRGFSGDGRAALSASLSGPVDVFPETDGSVLVLDTDNNRVRRLSEPGSNNPISPGVTTAGGLTAAAISVLHGATRKEEAVAPGQLVCVTGDVLGTTEVLFDSKPGKILAQDNKRLTVVLPPVLPPGFVEVITRSGSIERGRAAVEIVPLAPGLLAANEGTGPAMALNQDGKLNGPNEPAGRGSIVSLFVTGHAQSSSITADMGSYGADVVWYGPAPGLTGILQVQIQTPAGFSPSGVVPVTLFFDGVRTQAGVTLFSR